MRKKRKGKHGSRAAKKSPPKAVAKEKPFVRKYCYMCGDKPAKSLFRGDPDHGNKVFCGFVCAARCALEVFQESPVTWCIQHEMWTEAVGICILCDVEDTVRILSNDLLAPGSLVNGQVVTHE